MEKVREIIRMPALADAILDEPVFVFGAIVCAALAGTLLAAGFFALRRRRRILRPG